MDGYAYNISHAHGQIQMNNIAVLEGLFGEYHSSSQHWVSSIWVVPSSYLSVIGGQQQYMNVYDD